METWRHGETTRGDFETRSSFEHPMREASARRPSVVQKLQLVCKRIKLSLSKESLYRFGTCTGSEAALAALRETLPSPLSFHRTVALQVVL